jgi:hypothetical protein
MEGAIPYLKYRQVQGFAWIPKVHWKELAKICRGHLETAGATPHVDESIVVSELEETHLT